LYLFDRVTCNFLTFQLFDFYPMPEIQMPKLSDTMTEGTLVAWKKKKGDQVSAGEVLAEIETDKATMEWESPEDGTLTEIYVQEGGKVNVGDRIAFIGGEDEEAPKEEKEEKEEKPKAKEEEKKEEKPKKAEQPKEETPTTEENEERKAAPPKAQKKAEPEKPAPTIEKAEEARVKASPVARRIAAELGVDLSSVNGTGPEGRVTETDVRAAAKSKSAAPGTKVPAAVKAGESARIQLSGMRKIIAQRLVESLGPVPHFYLNIDIDAAPLMEAREELKSAGEDADAAKITVNDFVLKASVQAAVKVPRVNASFDGDAIVQYADIDLGIAVAIEDGLLTPVIRAAQNKSLREISELAKDLAHRARNKRMKPEEFQGGTFTVSNLGGMGIDSFSAVINPPQGFILAVGRITKVPVVDDCDQIIVGHSMSLTMSCDHRVIDGALGAEYLKELRHLLENPALLLV
jgi:pyruvate dehydrogenase E2 component (dihydrolipoamide acetyltransferase)